MAFLLALGLPSKFVGRAIVVWVVTAALVALFAVGGWYTWDGTSPATLPTSPAATVAPAKIELARRERLEALPDQLRLMLVGNSVAEFLTPGFKVTGAVTVFDASILGCSFPPNIDAHFRDLATNAEATSTPCHPAGEIGELAAFQPDVVVWAASDAPPPWSYRGATLRPCSEPYDSLYRAALSAEVERMQRRGARVAVTTEAYDRFTSPGLGVGALALSDRVVDCNNASRRRVAAATHAQLIDLFGWTCPRGNCLVRRGGVVLRPDGLHYDGPGARVAAQWILDELDQ